MELLRGDGLPICEAMKVWHFGDDQVAETVIQWWTLQADSTAPMPARLQRLNEMLPERLTRVDVEDAVSRERR